MEEAKTMSFSSIALSHAVWFSAEIGRNILRMCCARGVHCDVLGRRWVKLRQTSYFRKEVWNEHRAKRTRADVLRLFQTFYFGKGRHLQDYTRTIP